MVCIIVMVKGINEEIIKIFRNHSKQIDLINDEINIVDKKLDNLYEFVLNKK